MLTDFWTTNFYKFWVGKLHGKDWIKAIVQTQIIGRIFDYNFMARKCETWLAKRLR